MTHPVTTRAPHAAGSLPATIHNAALLIDFDNVTMGIRSDLQAQLRKLLNSELIRGKVAVQRAYADWRRYPQYIVPLSESSIDLIFAPAFGANKKNATDIRLAIDALELVFTRPEISMFILLSGDSDFSSLVLKLKEYGKYVIGVGIRESASDLLVQNCDEYYSYSELTGLAKEAQSDSLPRDPWEVVVEAVLRMKEQRDVMRSDRLKQVMQEIDPHFNEKDAGFNKFSKFVTEASRRRLITIEKMDNGQYEVDVGADANVPPASTTAEQTAQEEKRRGKRPSASDRSIGDRGMSLATAFQLLRQALQDLGAVGEEATDLEQVRARMIESAEDEDDQLFEAKRFQRMLRQAHDAHLIDLVKGDDDVYMLKLNPKASDADDGASEKRERPDAREGGAGRGRSKRKRTAKKPDGDSTASHRKPKAEEDEGPKVSKGSDRGDRSGAPVADRPARKEDTVEDQESDAGEQRRNPRFRLGSRVPNRKKAEPTAADADPAPPKAPAETPSSTGHRSLRGRVRTRGRRSSAGGEPATSETPQGATSDAVASSPSAPVVRQEPVPSTTAAAQRVAPDVTEPPAPSQPLRDPNAGEPPLSSADQHRANRPEESKAKTAAPSPETESKTSATKGEDDSGLLRRMTTAFQRAVLGQDDESS